MASRVPLRRARKREAVMNIEAAGTTRALPESFEKSLALIRRLLSTAGFSIVKEFDLSRESYFQLGIGSRSCVVLLVDTPVLLFEAIALDRSAAVFVPLHIVVTGDRDSSYVHWVNPMTSSGLRPPAPARGPLDALYARLTESMSQLREAADVSSMKQST